MDHGTLANVDLNLLVALDALLETCSVTQAASELHVTQSAMSHTLKRLRDTFHDPLFVRSGRTMLPTPAAEALAFPVRSALQQLQHALESRGRFAPATTTRTFRVATSDFVALTLIPAVTRRLRREAPHAELVVMQGTVSDVEALTTGELDLVLYPVSNDLTGLMCRTLFHERFVAVVRADHPDVGETLSLETYAALPHLLISPQGKGPARLDKVFAEHGHTRRIAVRVAHFISAPLVVVTSDLILTAPVRLARFAASFAPLRLLELPVEVPGFSIDAVWHERYTSDPANQWLRNLIGEVATNI